MGTSTCLMESSILLSNFAVLSIFVLIATAFVVPRRVGRPSPLRIYIVLMVFISWSFGNIEF